MPGLPRRRARGARRGHLVGAVAAVALTVLAGCDLAPSPGAPGTPVPTSAGAPSSVGAPSPSTPAASPSPSAGPAATGGATRTVSYEATGEDFANPERGLPERVDPPWTGVTWPVCQPPFDQGEYGYTERTEPLDGAALRAARAEGRSLVMMRFSLAEARDRDLPEDLLQRLRDDFATARDAGVKVVPRFVYNYPYGGPDAPADVVLRHLDQLAPVLRDSVDVIAFMDLGLIGCWGENHSSSNGLVEASLGYNRLTDGARAIIERAFQVLPAERQIAGRYVSHKFQYVNPVTGDGSAENAPIPPVSPEEAFDGSTRARWGHIDDCIVCGEWNAGTWWNPRTQAAGSAAEIRDFLAADTRFVVQSGELGAGLSQPSATDDDADGYTSDYGRCERVLPLLEQGHFSTLNHNDDQPVVAQWQQEGCADDIATRLGYRFRLTGSTAATTAAPGGALPVTLQVANDGFATPYNVRPVELVLRDTATGATTAVPVAADPRRWSPGTTTAVDATAALPATLPAGDYQVLLHLPDAAPTLRDRPEYAIRLANAGTWDPATGLNDLRQTVRVG